LIVIINTFNFRWGCGYCRVLETSFCRYIDAPERTSRDRGLIGIDSLSETNHEYLDGAMSLNRKKSISVGVLLAGYSAVIAGLFGLAAQPLIGVLMVLGGMALSICSAAELVQERPDPDSVSSGE
jgi:hypothetical protein